MAFLVIHFLTNHMKLQVDSWKNRFESIRFEQFSSLILRPLLVLGPSYFPEKSYDFVLLFDFSFSCFRPTIIVSENKNMIFQHFGRLFLPGTPKNIPYPLNELLVNFREESSGIGQLCRLEFQRMANWLSFDKKIETGRIIRNRRPVSSNSPCFDKKIETGPVGHPLDLRACKIGQSH